MQMKEVKAIGQKKFVPDSNKLSPCHFQLKKKMTNIEQFLAVSLNLPHLHGRTWPEATLTAVCRWFGVEDGACAAVTTTCASAQHIAQPVAAQPYFPDPVGAEVQAAS